MLIGGKIGMKLITAAKLQDYSQPDPYMIEANGKFYIYATGDDGVNVYRSDDLFGGYEYLGKTGAVEGKKEYWAPSVIELDGKFYMYVSCMRRTSRKVRLKTLSKFCNLFQLIRTLSKTTRVCFCFIP